MCDVLDADGSAVFADDSSVAAGAPPFVVAAVPVVDDQERGQDCRVAVGYRQKVRHDSARPVQGVWRLAGRK